MKKIILLASASFLIVYSPVSAQSQATVTTETTETTTTTTVPDEVRTYIVEQEAPTSIEIEGEIVIGEALPDTVEVVTVPDNDAFGYAVVNEQRVVLDPQTRTVIEIIEN